MKHMKYGIVAAVLLLLIGASVTVAAETITDPTGDVWHYAYSGTTWSWGGSVGDKPNIDITQISATAQDNKLTFSITVAGVIQSSEKVWYWAFYNTTDTTYYLSWSNGSGAGIASKQGGSAYDFVQNFTISGNTLSAVFNVLGSTTSSELWGYAAQYTTIGTNQTANEWWGDWAPNSKIPFSTTPGGNTGNNTGGNTGNNTGGNTGTPGFEVVPVLAAVAIAAILLRRRR
jgi:PGF-CTERM protein